MKKFCAFGFLLLGFVIIGSQNAHSASQTIVADIENFGAGDGDPSIFAGTANEAVVTLTLPAITSFDTIDLELAHAYGSDIEFRLQPPGGGDEIILVAGEFEVPGTGAHDDATPFGFNGGVDDPETVRNSQDVGDKAVLLSQTVLYTLDPTANVLLHDHFADPTTSGTRLPLEAGTYAPGEPTAGDFDLDSDVDGSDFLLWQSTYLGFFNAARDIDVWRAEYGNTSTPQLSWPEGSFPAGDWTLSLVDGYTVNDPGSLGDVTFNYTEVTVGITAVPEPGSVCLMLVGCSLFGLTRRNRS